MKLRRFVVTVIVLIAILLCPVSVAVQATDEAYYTERQAKPSLAPLGYDIRYLDKYMDDCDVFKEYIISEATSFNEVIDIKDYNLPVEDKVIEAIAVVLYKEAPELFNIDSISYSYIGNTLYNIHIKYLYTPEEYYAMLAECEAVADRILRDIKATPTLTQAEIALLIHDRLAVNCTYDQKMQNVNKFDIYGALVDGLAVCEGYTKSYTYLLAKMGIKSEFCASNELKHAWNIVYVDDKPYHVDVTWDDIGIAAGEVYHDNFLLSTDALYRGGSDFFINAHVASDYNSAPQDTTYDNYYWKNSYTEIQLINGELYYLDGKKEIIYKYTGGEPEEIFKGSARWNKYWNCYGRLSSNGEDLFYSTNTSVHFLNLDTRQTSLAFEPKEVKEQGLEIYGFMYKDGLLICDLAATNNYFNTGVLRVIGKYDPATLVSPVTPVSVVVASSPVRGYYIIGEELDTTGLELEVTYSDGSKKRVKEGITIHSYDPYKTGKQLVVVSCLDTLIEYEIIVCPKGDVNLDGTVSVADATAVQKYLASMAVFNSLQKKAANVNGDEVISISDATMIQKHIAGLLTIE